MRAFFFECIRLDETAVYMEEYSKPMRKCE